MLRLRGGCSGSDDGGDWDLCECLEKEAELKKTARDRYRLVQLAQKRFENQGTEVGGSENRRREAPETLKEIGERGDTDVEEGEIREKVWEEPPWTRKGINPGLHVRIRPDIPRALSQPNAGSVNKEEKGVTAVGTMGYAPPELFSGNVEARSDIYSLGSTMFHLLTGADPQSNPLLIFDFQKNPRPRQINPQLSDQMERILMRAVEYNADKRFTSAAEMRRSSISSSSNALVSSCTSSSICFP